MKIFISWSGEKSRKVAELLSGWTQCVIQIVEPWVSSVDIDRGSLWFSEIANQLSSTTHGIICLTKSNKEKPWILFEAGALAKGLTSSRVYTLLIDLNPEDIQDPLAQFNHTLPHKENIYKLITSINNSLQEKRLKDHVLKSVFETYWPQFESEFKKILKETKEEAVVEKRNQEDLLTEMLNSIRNIDRRIRSIEQDKEVSKEATPERKAGINRIKRMINSMTQIRKMVDDCVSDDEIINTFKDEHTISWIVKQIEGARQNE